MNGLLLNGGFSCMQDDGQCVFVKVDLGPTNRKELDFAHYFAKFDLLNFYHTYSK